MLSKSFSKRLTKLGLSAVCLLALAPLCTQHIHASHISWADSYKPTRTVHHTRYYSHKPLLIQQNTTHQYDRHTSHFYYHPYHRIAPYRKIRRHAKPKTRKRMVYGYRFNHKLAVRKSVKRHRYAYHKRNKSHSTFNRRKRIDKRTPVYKPKRHVRKLYKKHVIRKALQHVYKRKKVRKFTIHHYAKRYNTKKAYKKAKICRRKLRRSRGLTRKRIIHNQFTDVTQRIHIKKAEPKKHIYVPNIKKHVIKHNIVTRNNEIVYNSILNLAKSKLGDSYAWGGNGPDAFDCSGFTKYIYQYGAHKNLPRLANYQYYDSPHVSASNRRPGDLVFFGNDINNITHVGMYVGNDMMIDAQSRGVIVEKITVPWWHAVGYARPLA